MSRNAHIDDVIQNGILAGGLGREVEMAKQFNPPPNWPQPPLNWKPGPSWEPDPRWGSPPDGWQLWVDADEKPAAKAADKRPPQRIFLSYRRSDCQPQANGLHDGLRFRLPSAHLFMDIEAIPPGVDFEEHIRAEIQVCDLVLVLIGDNWLDVIPETGKRRIDDPGDFVRLEIEAALKSPRCRVVPVLVEGALMPRAAELPESIARLARINAIELSDQRWKDDLERLSKLVETIRKEELAYATRTDAEEGSHEVEPAPAEPVPVELTDIVETAVSAAVAAQPGTFRTKDVSQSPGVLSAHDEVSSRPKYDEMVGRYLYEHRTRLGLKAPTAATDSRGWAWTKSVPSWTPPAVMPPSNSSPAVGWVLAFVPLVTCGLGAFAPAVWLASKRPGETAFRMWAYSLAAVATVLALVGMILFGSAPTGFDGSPTGPQADVGGTLWFGSMLATTVVAVIAMIMHTNRQNAAAPGPPAWRP